MPDGQEQDMARPVLDPLQVDNSVKRQAWDAFHNSRTPEEFRAYFDNAPIPQAAKRALWDAKWGGATQQGAQSLKPTTADNEVERAKPSWLGRIGWEAASVPPRAIGVPVTKNPVGDWLGSMVKMAGDTLNPLRFGPPKSLKDIVGEMDETSAEGRAIREGGRELVPAAASEPGAMQLRRGGPIVKQGRELEHPELAGGVRTAASFLPILGPGAVKAGHELATGQQGDVFGGLGDAATVLGQAALATKEGQETAEKAVSPVTKPVSRFLTTNKYTRAPYDLAAGTVNRLRTPEAQEAFTQAIQPGVNIPKAQESIAIAGPRIQQIRKAQGIEIPEKGPEALKAVLDLNREAKTQILSAIEDRIGPVAQLRPNTASVAKAMRASVDDITLEEGNNREAVEKAAQRYEREGANAWTLRQMEERLQTLNNRLGKFYSRPTGGEGTIPVQAELDLAEAGQLRKVIDESVENLSGDGVKELKREYGAQRDVEKSLARQYAVATRVKGAPLWEGLAYLQAAGDLVTGGVWGAAKAAGRIAIGNRMQLLRDAGYLANQSFQGKGAFPAASPIERIGPPTPKGLLPAPATQAGWTGDTSGPVNDPTARWTNPKALIGDTPVNAQFLRTIPREQPAAGPQGLLQESNAPATSIPPAVDPKFMREIVRPPETSGERAPETQLGTMGEGGVRQVVRGQLPGESLEGAKLLVRQTLDMMQSGDRPGRYFDEMESSAEGRKGGWKTGLRMGGQWRGVGSMREMLPWIGETDFTPSELENALRLFEKGKINRVMRSAMEFLDRQGKSASGATTAESEPGADEGLEFSTDNNGTRWAESPDGYRVSIPKRISEEEVEDYAREKLEEQRKIHGQIKGAREVPF